MKTNELVFALLRAETCILGAECSARFDPHATPAAIADLLDSAARYIDQARAALAQSAAAEVQP